MVDTELPAGQIDMPVDDTVVMAPNMMDNVAVDVLASGSDGPADCGGVKEVRLLINGKEVGGTDNMAPYEFKAVSFPTGCWEVSVRLIDWFDNQTDSASNTLCVNSELPPPPVDPTTGMDSASGSDSGTGEPTDTDGPDGSTGVTSSNSGSASASASASASDSASGTAGEKDESGCACSSGHDPKGSALMLLGLALLGRRRRRG
jgi:MYXO-CTERM domain-containing protein